MVCTANDLQQWKDFPKGLKVLLLEGETNCAADIRTKLESMDYNVSAFSDENEALSAISSKSGDFHIAIVEVSISDGEGGFRFLENVKDLPTIMTSNHYCLNTMMKCIALGAVEFLSKPLSEDKLRNIWQHVVHKAFNAGASVVSESLKPVKESVVSMLQLNTENGQEQSMHTDNDHDPASDKYPAPSTPQLNQGTRLLDDGDCQEQTNCSMEKDSGEHDGEGESKSVETTCVNMNAASNPEPPKVILQEQTNCSTEKNRGKHDGEGESKSVETTCVNMNAESNPEPPKSEKTPVKKEEGDFAKSSKGETCNTSVCTHSRNRKVLNSIDGNTNSSNKVRVLNNSCTIKAHRKKMKVDWTPELHKKFVKAVEQLGLDQAIPSRILDLMKVEGLTRHNVASHLQKYRMHKRQILPKEDERKWLNQRDQMQRSYCLQRPVMAFPTYHSNHTVSPAPVYPMWRQTDGQTAAMQFWGSPGYPMWQPAESWHWKPLPGMHADAWGCPVLPSPQAPPCYPYPHPPPGQHSTNAVDYKFSMPQSSFEHQPEDEVVDKVVKEAINKPWLPLPIGLKPPSTDSVLAELSRQGMSTIPRCTKRF